jgi:inorganic pyrophosphatase/exopolyphosphatase
MLIADTLSPLHATLLLGVISLDTANFSKDMDKATQRDVDISQTLQTQSLEPRAALFAWLQQAKFDSHHWTRFSASDCLRYDFKKFSCGEWDYGVSSVLIPLQRLVDKADALSALSHFVRANRLSFLLVMALDMDLQRSSSLPSREILVFSPHNETLDLVRRFLASTETLETRPIEMETLSPDDLCAAAAAAAAFRQSNVKMSRKQVVPLLQTFLENVIN